MLDHPCQTSSRSASVKTSTVRQGTFRGWKLFVSLCLLAFACPLLTRVDAQETSEAAGDAVNVTAISDEVQLVPSKAEGVLRIATFNVSLNRPTAGKLYSDLQSGNEQAERIAAIIRAVQPDILLLNEVDYSATEDNARIFVAKYLSDTDADLLGGNAWTMPHRFQATVNTGVPSGMDLNQNTKTEDPEDAWGYGKFPGQYGMAILSRYPIEQNTVRTLQNFLWSQLPEALRPELENGAPYYDDATWAQLRLSSKSFWDVPIKTPQGTIHAIASHPTPPAFDGPEDRNGCRNHDEIKLIQYYIEGNAQLRDDSGNPGGLGASDAFVVLGDLNSDPQDGGSRTEAIRDLLSHPRIRQFEAPRSQGAVAASKTQGGANEKQQGVPAEDTADFNDRNVGNLRVDYVLPSQQLEAVASGVFWPSLEQVEPSQRETLKQCLSASDHRLVWVDVKMDASATVETKRE